MPDVENGISSADSIENKSDLEKKYDSVSKEVKDIKDDTDGDSDNFDTAKKAMNEEFSNFLSANQETFSAFKEQISNMNGDPRLSKLSDFLDDFNKSRDEMKKNFENSKNEMEQSFSEFKNGISQDKAVDEDGNGPVETKGDGESQPVMINSTVLPTVEEDGHAT